MSSRFYLICCIALLLLIVGVGSCVEPYEPVLPDAPRKLLVVDGFINGQGVTRIQLTRTSDISAQGLPTVETGAKLTIQQQGLSGGSSLREVRNGVYESESLQLQPGASYRLFIQTKNGRQYASDYLPLKQPPPIQELRAAIEPTGVQLYLSTHDPQANTRYYRWQFAETWEFFTPYKSFYYWDIQKQTFVRRVNDINHCWRTEESSNVIVTSTEKFTEDRVRDYRLHFIPSTSSRILYQYSILVRQYAMSQGEYEYWQALKKNTEDIGTLFDPLPTQLTGNVHSLNVSDEQVLGFVAPTTTVEKRIFINHSEVPLSWGQELEGYEQCERGEFVPDVGYGPADYFYDTINNVPLYQSELGWYSSSRDCVDCRRRGSSQKPSFFP